MHIKKTAILLLITGLFLTSCSSDKKKDTSGATSVFSLINRIKIDESTKDLAITIPDQKTNSSWSGSNFAANEQAIENFTFSNKINKIKSIWSGRNGDENNKSFRPIVENSIVYLLDGKGNLVARNLTDYKKIWQKNIFGESKEQKFINGKIFINNGTIFATSGFNYIAAIDAKNGNIIWSKKLSSMSVSTPIVKNDQLFVTTSDNQTYAFNVANGQLNWVHSGINKNTSILGAADPIFYKNYVISAYSSGEVYALDQKTGDAEWSKDLNINKAIDSDFILNDVDATPIVKNNVIYAIGNGGLMMAINADKGSTIWQKELSSISDFWIANNFIYLINNENNLICLERVSGKIKWFKSLEKDNIKPEDRANYFGLIMAGNNLILANSHNEILIISPQNGEILQKKNVGQDINHTPIIVDGKLYLSGTGAFTNNLIVVQ